MSTYFRDGLSAGFFSRNWLLPKLTQKLLLLVGWFDGACLLTDWLTDLLPVWLIDLRDWLTDCLTDWLTDWLTGLPTNRPTDRRIDRPTDWLFVCLTDRLTWLAYWLTEGWLADRPTDRLAVWLTTSWLTDLVTNCMSDGWGDGRTKTNLILQYILLFDCLGRQSSILYLRTLFLLSIRAFFRFKNLLPSADQCFCILLTDEEL